MKRSEVINCGRQRPLDQAVNQIYSNYILLLKEITDNWKQELVGGLVGQRFYEDLKDVRVETSRDGTVILRLKPVIGLDTEEEVSFYLEFFKMYKKLTKSLLSLIMTHQRNVAMIKQAEFTGLEAKPFEIWKIQHNARIHQLFMTLKILVGSMYLEQLKSEDLYRFDLEAFVERGELDIFVASMDALVREYGMSDTISTQFADNQASFYHHPDSVMLGAYYRYAQKIVTPKPDRLVYDPGKNWGQKPAVSVN